MINRLYVFANMGKLNKLPKSGGQSSARRVMEGFKSEGIEIIPIRRHRAELQTKFGHVLEVGYFAFYDLAKMIAKMILRRRKNAAFMQMTYAGALVPYEFILSLTARLMGFKSIEYLQGGLVMDTFPKKGKFHKWLFRKNMEMQAFACFEGLDALKLTEAVAKKTPLEHFPSYVFDDKIPDLPPIKPHDEINFCFFGRISKAKNVLISIQIFNLFSERNPKTQTSFTIVGGGDNEQYLHEVSEAIENSPYRDRIKRYGNSSYDFLVEMMQKQHFYLFPTQEKAEGHSNALNEAMSQGVIPIACDYHFNKSVIGEDFLVVKGYEPIDYVKAIEYVLNHVDMEALSKKLWKRVKDLYSYSKVNKSVCQQLKML